ncbi:hypothetical protein D046_8241A, partial [Vibrio parahaemolyticus V-223/04]
MDLHNQLAQRFRSASLRLLLAQCGQPWCKGR